MTENPAGLISLDTLGAKSGDDISVFLHHAWSLLPRGGTIAIPPGNFTISETVILSGRPLRLIGRAIGDGRNGTMLTLRTGADHGLWFKKIRGLHIADLTLHGDGMKPGSFLLCLSDSIAYATIERCLIEHGANGLWIRRANRVRITATTFRNFTDKQVILLNGTGADGRNHAVEFMNSTIRANHDTTDNIVQNGPGASTKLIGSYVGFGRHGYWQHNTTPSPQDPNFFYVTAGGFESGTGDCIRLECGQKALLGGGAYFSSRGDGDGISLRGTFTSCIVSGCYIRGNGRHGIFHDSGTLTVSGSQIINNGFSARPSERKTPPLIQAPTGTLIPNTTWDTGDRIQITTPDGTTTHTDILPCNLPNHIPAGFAPLAIPEGSQIARLGQGIRSTANAGPALIGATWIGAEKGGPNLQEHPILSDNPNLRTDQDTPPQIHTLHSNDGHLTPRFLTAGLWQPATLTTCLTTHIPDATITLTANNIPCTPALPITTTPTRHPLHHLPTLDADPTPLLLGLIVTPPEAARTLALDIAFRRLPNFQITDSTP